MKKIIISVVTVAALLGGCSPKKQNDVATRAIDTLKTFILKKESVTKVLALPVQLFAWERTELFAKVPGYVKELYVNFGDHIKKNDILVVIDAPEMASNYARAVADNQSFLAKYQTSLDEYRRISQAAHEPGVVSDHELERVRNQMRSDSANYEAARLASNSFGQLKSYLTIHAPFDGVITRRFVDPGALVSTTTPILIAEDMRKIRLRVALPEVYTASRPDADLAFTVDAQPGKTYHAVFSRRSSKIDDATHTELWEFECSNPDGELKPGMYGVISLAMHRLEASFVVPQSAVITNQERNAVIRIIQGKTEWVDVKNGLVLGNKIEIFGPLAEGDQLVLRGNDEIKSGAQFLYKNVQ